MPNISNKKEPGSNNIHRASDHIGQQHSIPYSISVGILQKLQHQYATVSVRERIGENNSLSSSKTQKGGIYRSYTWASR